VPFLHITTRIDDHPYDSLLREKGGTGFPTLMFLDPGGRKLMRYRGPRTVKGFEESLGDVEEFTALLKRAEQGDKKVAGKLFIRQLELEWFSFEEATRRYKKLTKVSGKEKKQIESLLVDTEVRTITKDAGRDEDKCLSAGKHFLGMWKDKQIPGSDAQLYSFWLFIANYAEEEGDKKLFKKTVAEFKKSVGTNRQYRKALKVLEERLENFTRS
jgi:hypothetical protein